VREEKRKSLKNFLANLSSLLTTVRFVQKASFPISVTNKLRIFQRANEITIRPEISIRAA